MGCMVPPANTPDSRDHCHLPARDGRVRFSLLALLITITVLGIGLSIIGAVSHYHRIRKEHTARLAKWIGEFADAADDLIIASRGPNVGPTPRDRGIGTAPSTDYFYAVAERDIFLERYPNTEAARHSLAEQLDDLIVARGGKLETMEENIVPGRGKATEQFDHTWHFQALDSNGELKLTILPRCRQGERGDTDFVFIVELHGAR